MRTTLISRGDTHLKTSFIYLINQYHISFCKLNFVPLFALTTQKIPILVSKVLSFKRATTITFSLHHYLYLTPYLPLCLKIFHVFVINGVERVLFKFNI